MITHIYVARTGPNNSNLIDPDNSILICMLKIMDAKDSLIGRVPIICSNKHRIYYPQIKISSLNSFNKRNY